MRKTLIFFTLLAAAAIVTVGCGNEPTPPGPIPEWPVGDVPFELYYAARWNDPIYSLRWVDIYEDSDGDGMPDVLDGGEVIVIDSDEELQKYVEGDYPTVDFSRKTLLLAYGLERSLMRPDGQKFQKLSEQDYVMTVNLTGGMLTSMSRWVVAVVVDKLPSGSEIELNITKWS
jgi:hypothetical protein